MSCAHLKLSNSEIVKVRFWFSSGVADLDGLELYGATKALEKSLAKKALRGTSWDRKLNTADDILSESGFWDVLWILLRLLA